MHISINTAQGGYIVSAYEPVKAGLTITSSREDSEYIFTNLADAIAFITAKLTPVAPTGSY